MHPPQSTVAKSAEMPSPGVLLVLFSIPALLAYLALATLGCVAIFAGFGCTSYLGGGIWVYFAGCLTWLHYRAVFRGEYQAARDARNMFSFIAAVLGVIIAVLLIRLAWILDPYFVHGTTVLFLALLFSLTNWWLLGHWSRTLEKFRCEGNEAASAKRYSLREILLAVTVAACVLGASSLVLKRWEARLVEHAAAADCPFQLPVAAHDVSYCYSPWGQLAYEFSIGKEGAAEWAEHLDLYVVQNIAAPLEVKRFGSLHPSLRRDQNVTITHGWHSAGYVNGKQVLIAYDEDGGRAYYYMTEP